MKLSPVANINRRFNSGHVHRDSRSLARFRFAAIPSIAYREKHGPTHPWKTPRMLKEEADFVM
jgi:hypothetical protein